MASHRTAPPPPPSGGSSDDGEVSETDELNLVDGKTLFERAEAAKALKRALVSHLTQFGKIFSDLDRGAGRRGEIDKVQFRRAIKQLKLYKAKDSATFEAVTDSVFDEFDLDDSGTVNFQEFVHKTLRLAIERSAKRIQDLFLLWDADNSGTIDKDEFRRAMTTIGINAPRAILDAFFDEIDEDKSGEIEFKELKNALKEKHEGPEDDEEPQQPKGVTRGAGGARPTSPVVQRILATGDGEGDRAVYGFRPGESSRPTSAQVLNEPSNASSSDEEEDEDEDGQGGGGGGGLTTEEIVSALARQKKREEEEAEKEAEKQDIKQLEASSGDAADGTAAAEEAEVEVLSASDQLRQTLRSVIASRASKISIMFSLWDSDGSGLISSKEFKKAVRALSIGEKSARVRRFLSDEVDEAALDDVFADFDDDRSGQLSRVEVDKKLKQYAGLLVEQKHKLRREGTGVRGVALSSSAKLSLPSSSPSPDANQHAQAGEAIGAQLRALLQDNLARVIDLFRQWDEDENGTIDKKEFSKAMRSLGLGGSGSKGGGGKGGSSSSIEDKAKDKAISDLFESFDPDGSGTIEYSELRKMLAATKQAKPPPPATPASPATASRRPPTPMSAPFRRRLQPNQHHQSTPLLQPAVGRPRPSTIDSLSGQAGALSIGAAQTVNRITAAAETNARFQKWQNSVATLPRHPSEAKLGPLGRGAKREDGWSQHLDELKQLWLHPRYNSYSRWRAGK